MDSVSAAAQHGHDWPLTLAGACGRIDAYRDALAVAADALELAVPYVGGVIGDQARTVSAHDAATVALAAICKASLLARRELTVTT